MRFIESASLVNFRCYKNTQILTLEDINIFAGKNNSGKSALIQGIFRLCTVNVNRHPRVAKPGGASYYGPSTYLQIFANDWRDKEATSELNLTVNQEAIVRGIKNLGYRYPAGQKASVEATQQYYRALFDYVLWPFTVKATFSQPGGTKIEAQDQAGALKDPQNLPNYDPNNKIGADSLKPDSLAKSIVDLFENLPIVHIPENRSLTIPLEMETVLRADEFQYEIVNANLLPAALLQYYFEDPGKLQAFKDCLATIMEDEVNLTFKPSAKTMLLSVGKDSPRPIENLGAGIVQLMIYSLTVTKYDGGLLLFEEPELHLHPTMQRRLLKSIQHYATTGQWQALITTHSNHILDFETKANITTFVVQRANDETRVKQLDKKSIIEAIEVLGARPSSLLESNTIIWVEGPSDAIYIKFWINFEASRLGINIEEFVDYAFSFFGGANLKHAGFSFAPVPQLINLLSIHPNSLVVIDSDRVTSSQAPQKDYTREFVERSHDACRIWLTQGREIENYLHDKVLNWAVNDLRLSIDLTATDRDYSIFSEQVATLRDNAGLSRAAHDASEKNKVGFARICVEELMSKDKTTDWLERLNLRVSIHKFIKFILLAREPNAKIPQEILSA